MNLDINIGTLAISFVLVLITVGISQKEQLDLTKDILVAMGRMILQLVIMGYMLTYLFQLNNSAVTLLMVLVMILNAAYHTSKRGKGIRHVFRNSFIAMATAALLSLFVLLLSGSVQFIPQQVIPIMGMIASSSMTALGLSYKQLFLLYGRDRQQIQEMLALGATTKQASSEIIRYSIKAALQPTVDSAKTVGLVSLPGMMSGLMFAGVVPTKAILYQIMVYFMIMATTGIASILGVYLSYPSFFTDRMQVK